MYKATFPIYLVMEGTIYSCSFFNEINRDVSIPVTENLSVCPFLPESYSASTPFTVFSIQARIGKHIQHVCTHFF